MISFVGSSFRCDSLNLSGGEGFSLGCFQQHKALLIGFEARSSFEACWLPGFGTWEHLVPAVSGSGF